MTISAQDAINSITSGMTVTELRALANTVDASVGDATLLLYSGGVGTNDGFGNYEYGAGAIARDLADGTNIKTISNTEISSFLNDTQFINAVQDAINADIALNGTASPYYGRTVNQVLNGFDANNIRVTSNSFWDDASRNLVNQHTGSFELIMPNAPDNSVAIQTEIPALLQKSNGVGITINGISLQDWQQSHDAAYTTKYAAEIANGKTFAEADAIARVYADTEINDVIRLTSKANLADLGIGHVGNLPGGELFIDTNNSYLSNALNLPEKVIPPDITLSRVSGVAFMDIPHENLSVFARYGDLLNKAGFIGDVLGTTIAVAQAQAAYDNGDPVAAGEILAAHMGGLMGGWGVGTVSASVVTALLAIPGVNVGVVTGMLLVGGAGFIGGYGGGVYGESLFKDIYQDISNLGIGSFSQQLYDDYKWGLQNPGAVFAEIGNALVSAQAMFQQAEAVLPPQRVGDPIIFDLNGNGVELTSRADSKVYFNIEGTSFQNMTAWATGGDGMLVDDINQNGVIDDVNEVIGGNTASGGFAALVADYDTNHDGLLNASDTAFGRLRVWTDTDEDGRTDAGELSTLSGLGITSLNLNAINVNYQISGNNITQESVFTINGQERTMVDAWFAFDTVNTVYRNRGLNAAYL